MTGNGIVGGFRGDGLNRYAPVKDRPKTLADDFIDELLEATGGGRARDFETSRDHAIIRILRSEGIRRSELLGMTMHTLPADVIRNPMIRLVPLKGARAAGDGRLIVLAPPQPGRWPSTCVPAGTIPSPTPTGSGWDPRPGPVCQHRYRYPQNADPRG